MFFPIPDSRFPIPDRRRWRALPRDLLESRPEWACSTAVSAGDSSNGAFTAKAVN